VTYRNPLVIVRKTQYGWTLTPARNWPTYHPFPNGWSTPVGAAHYTTHEAAVRDATTFAARARVAAINQAWEAGKRAFTRIKNGARP
jgi:hypothetical protein